MKSLKEKLNGNELDLSLCELTEVPVKELLALPKATHLDLSCNFLLALPISFSSLTFVTQLDLSKNQITELPYNFGNLKQLQHLDVYGNQLSSLPVSVCQLKKLRWLDLKNNPLEAKLQAIAGDCLDQKQCQQCAVKVVEYLSIVNSELEREKQKKLKQERANEYARKQQQEKEAQRLRELKKAERESKKVQKMKKKNNSEKFESDNQNISNNGIDHVLGEEESEEKISVAAHLLYYLKWGLFLLISMTLMIFATNVFLRFKMGHKLSSVNDVVSVSCEEVTKLKYKALKIWHLSSEESGKLFTTLRIYFHRLYSKYTGPDMISKAPDSPESNSEEL